VELSVWVQIPVGTQEIDLFLHILYNKTMKNPMEMMQRSPVESSGGQDQNKQETIQLEDISAWERKNFYERLNVNRNATEDEINKAHRRLSLVYHPDRVSDNEELRKNYERVSILIGQAKQELTDSETRRKYDSKTFFTEEKSQPSGKTGYTEKPFWKNDDFFKSTEWAQFDPRRQAELSPEDLASIRANEGPDEFAKFIQELKEKGDTNIGRFIKLPQVQKAILRNAIDSLDDGIESYTFYLKWWKELVPGFDRTYIDKNPTVIKMIYTAAYRSVAEEGPHGFESYIRECEESGLISKESFFKHPQILEAMKRYTREIVDSEGSDGYKSTIEDWKRCGLNREIFDKDPGVQKIIMARAREAHQEGRYEFQSFVAGWKDAGIQIK
jgi:curved DNA-binding protein CbpA